MLTKMCKVAHQQGPPSGTESACSEGPEGGTFHSRVRITGKVPGQAGVWLWSWSKGRIQGTLWKR